jgi:nitrite reductase (cytochrome c-552)
LAVLSQISIWGENPKIGYQKVNDLQTPTLSKKQICDRTGIHARSGVACADCHMPYMRVGATKISDHHVRSPLLNINHVCQTCHRWPEAELQARVDTTQGRTYTLRNLAMDALMDLIQDLKAARAAGRTDEQLATARDFQRKAQFYLDFIEAENSMGFHAPQEAVRILGESINFSRKGELAIRPLQ